MADTIIDAAHDPENRQCRCDGGENENDKAAESVLAVSQEEHKDEENDRRTEIANHQIEEN